MTPKDLLLDAVDPALGLLGGLGLVSDGRARLLVLAIAGQESEWRHRRQIGGPARSFWQGEQSGGMILAIHHAATAGFAARVFQALEIGEPSLGSWVRPGDHTVYEAIAWHDVLAATLARLLLWTDPAALPAVGDVNGAWAYYQRTWRPGAPHPELWPARYGTAMGLCQ